MGGLLPLLLVVVVVVCFCFFKSAYKVMSFITACLSLNEKCFQAFHLHQHELAANGQAAELEEL